MSWIQKLKSLALEILFPIPELPDGLRLFDTLFCSVCRARQPNNVKTCHKNSSYKLGSAVSYNDDTIRKMIWRLKYRGRTGYAPILAQLLEKYLENLNLKLGTYTVIPIPLSKKRLGERGYNQAAIIAKLVAERFRLNFEEGALIRVKDTKAQMEVKSWDDRKTNIAGCFGITEASLVEKKNIILIDDVFTSGSTISEAARTLKAAGAGRI